MVFCTGFYFQVFVLQYIYIFVCACRKYKFIFVWFIYGGIQLLLFISTAYMASTFPHQALLSTLMGKFTLISKYNSCINKYIL